MGVSFAGSAKYGDRDAAAIRANRPVPPQAAVYFYEVTILDKGVSGYIGIGLSHRTVSLSRLPGWEDKSYGYHADDGRAFCSQGTGEPFGPTFTTGDVIGCGVDWTGAGPPVTEKERSGLRGAAAKEAAAKGGGGRAFFTKNGEFIGYAFCNLQGKLYPTVGLRTPNEAIRVNFGNEPFRFDIEGFVRERKRTIVSRLASTPLASTCFLPSPAPPIPALLPPTPQDRLHDTLQAVISAYLVHHGYAETARAFTEQISEERLERAQGLLPSTTFTTSSSAPASNDSDDLVASIAASSALRSEIRQAALSGAGAERALALVQEHYPTAFADDADAREEDGGMLFKLRCRVFLEKVLEWSRASRDPAAMESEGPDGVAMDEEAETIRLDSLLTLGQSLHAQYSADPRPVVRAELQAVLGLMAYRDPENEATGRTRELGGKAEREKVADELNRAVLRAANLPPVPALEALYRHASASIRLAGDVGCGSAAMVDMWSEVLGDLTGA
ncbi:ran-binding protein [Rhodotorula toruloides]|uniref:Ran-binding protein n=1 Tax=Rhodotorula toruloides TaxID=5286 RepID=A0A511KR60_RHOTO|nr:ran-binding protein [Rhodotorula toruloides]